MSGTRLTDGGAGSTAIGPSAKQDGTNVAHGTRRATVSRTGHHSRHGTPAHRRHDVNDQSTARPDRAGPRATAKPRTLGGA
ncbi:hypothetical protein LK07_09755 [Streptomyces pluripotens]|uniref:Uncharacterized protein n=1 Tax=Streptomyces pluripotens TaxID=1355015 RepID=A0A221NW99_9ACTN|nr:hypothetical protein LK06_008645 [Streptomyces pluripotens]ASN24283.1 hypothetical protein LK07_09755 [Streptomyces pluripotens]KIE25311.1 hypothetical protein LK08_19850 [Streptomyces sp. MUSC 125]